MRLLSRLLRFPRMRGPPLPAPTSRVCSWNTYNMKHLLQHKSKTDETFRTYSCNICVWPLQHMQHRDKTLTIYVWNKRNIHLQHTCIASATYATSR
jgi:hypothetical protein